MKVILLVGAVMNLSSAMQNFSGGKYDGYANKVYTMIPGMRGVDILRYPRGVEGGRFLFLPLGNGDNNGLRHTNGDKRVGGKR